MGGRGLERTYRVLIHRSRTTPISGYMRTFNLNLSSIKNVIFSKFDEVDVFLHITKDEEAQDKYMNISNQDNLDEINKALNP